MSDRPVAPLCDLSRRALSLADVEAGQRWRDRHTGEHFKVLRRYRDNRLNPTYRIEYEQRGHGRAGVTFDFFRAYCERAER
jgi:hypothetical protein